MENMFRQNYWTRNKTFYFLNHKSLSSDGFSCMTTSNTVDSDRPCMFPFKYPRFSLVCITFFRNTQYFSSSSFLIINMYICIIKNQTSSPSPKWCIYLQGLGTIPPPEIQKLLSFGLQITFMRLIGFGLYSSIIDLIFRRSNGGKDDIFYNCTPADNIKEWCFTRLNNDSTRFRCKY